MLIFVKHLGFIIFLIIWRFLFLAPVTFAHKITVTRSLENFLLIHFSFLNFNILCGVSLKKIPVSSLLKMSSSLYNHLSSGKVLGNYSSTFRSALFASPLILPKNIECQTLKWTSHLFENTKSSLKNFPETSSFFHNWSIHRNAWTSTLF